jgi:glucose/mannose transport system permease protein
MGVFVYGLIAWTTKVSLSDRHTALPESSFVGLDNYSTLLSDERFRHAIINLGIFVVAFVGGTLLMGLFWAYLLDRGVRAESLFRSVFIFPIAISFIASGVVWRWLLNGGTGDDAAGINEIFGLVGLDFLQNRWMLDPDWGMAAVAVPAIWQIAGYVMAIFLAGFRGIPTELREAAIVDGASTSQLYRHVLFPQLTPAALSALVIVGHIGVKVFDLIMSMSGNGYLTEVPAVYIWNTLLSSDYAKASAIAVLLLAAVTIFILPYLIFSIRREREISA